MKAAIYAGKGGPITIDGLWGMALKALRLPDMPVPDVTTESGRRMLLVHMDGDGFVSARSLPLGPIHCFTVPGQHLKRT